MVEQLNPQQRRGGPGAQVRGVYKSQITPHWIADGDRFWYRNDLKGGTKEFILVDTEKRTRQAAFDHEKLAASLSKAANQEFKADKLPFSNIEFVDDDKAIKFDAADKTWHCDLTSYECTAVTSSESKPAAGVVPNGAVDATQSASLDPAANDEGTLSSPQTQGEQNQAQGQRRGGRGRGAGIGGRFGPGPRNSPDTKWSAFVRDSNVFIRSQEDSKEYQLTQDGATNDAYGRIEWSADSKTLVAWRIDPGNIGDVYLIQSSPTGGGRAKLQTRRYAQAADRFPRYELSLFNIAERKQIKPEVDRFEHEWLTPNLRWNKDHVHFTYEQEDRGHQRFRIIDVDASNGAVRNIVDEKTKTFIWTAHAEDLENRGLRHVTYLDDTGEIIYSSEMDGWRHLYLIDAATGKMKNQITKGEWVVRGVDKIDEENRQIWFQASGLNLDQDPYFIHYCRVNFDGTGFVTLTDGNGNHTIQYSPDRKYLIDTYSRPDMPPKHELRRVSDGKLVCRLEEADISELEATGWKAPEVFVAKGRDGKTDIWGNIYFPHNVDPNKKYPILEDIYGGPQDSYTPKSFSGGNRYERYNQLGFIVVKLDGMGTANRSKAFHDVCWHNLKDGGFPDRILWIKAAAAKHPFMDIDHVGIFGTSAGGQNAAAAVLFHPEFYKVAVANSGCHDNRIDKASWNEQWMGYMSPDKIWEKSDDNRYSQCSNIDNAAKLRGKLLLIVGEMDTNVPPESTMRFVDALIKAGKDFDLIWSCQTPITALRVPRTVAMLNNALRISSSKTCSIRNRQIEMHPYRRLWQATPEMLYPDRRPAGVRRNRKKYCDTELALTS